jgi:hypothetical protein
MTCPECHTEARAGERYCPRCGIHLPAPGLDRDLAWASFFLALAGPSFLLVFGFPGSLVALFRPAEVTIVNLLLLVGFVLLLTPALWILSLFAIVTGLIAWRRARKAPTEYGGKRLAQLGTALGVIQLSIVTVLLVQAVDPLLFPESARVKARARSAAAASEHWERIRTAEKQVLREIRAVIRAEAEYAGANGGRFGGLECLTEPDRCLSGYEGPPFLDPSVLRPHGSGYRRTFHPGPEAANVDRSLVAPGSLTRFAYVAVPFVWGETGNRGFCAEGNGVTVAFGKSEESHVLVDGRCDRGLEPQLGEDRLISLKDRLIWLGERKETVSGSITENEAAARTEVRAVLLAERAHRQAVGRFSDGPACLARPGICLTNYDGPVFLDDALVSEVRMGYRHRYLKSRSRGADDRPSGFIVTAIPNSFGYTGERAFCADHRGVLCATREGERRDLRWESVDSCPDWCVPLERIEMQ